MMRQNTKKSWRLLSDLPFGPLSDQP
jgi:hypothetical protein